MSLSPQAHFGNTARRQRRRILRKNFHFWCECEACRGDFPESASLPRGFADDPRVVEAVGREEAERRGTDNYV